MASSRAATWRRAGDASVPPPRGPRRVVRRVRPAHEPRGARAARRSASRGATASRSRCGNSVEYVVAAFGVLKAGGVLNPVNPALGAAELALHPRARRAARRGDRRRERRRRAARRLGRAGTALDDAGSATAPDDAARRRRSVPTTPRRCSTPRARPGQPKGVALHPRPHRHQRPALHRRARASRRDDVILAVTPLFHGNAWGAVVTALLRRRHRGVPEGVLAPRSSGRWCTRPARRCSTRSGTVLAMLLTREPSELERTQPAARHPRPRQRADPRPGDRALRRRRTCSSASARPTPAS